MYLYFFEAAPDEHQVQQQGMGLQN